MREHADIAIIGAGIVGISTAFHLLEHRSWTKVVLIDAGAPMSLTSAVSGENYRDWWPHPTIAALCARSIEITESIARRTDNRCQISRHGYAYVTRTPDTDSLVRGLEDTYAWESIGEMRVHEGGPAPSYQPNHFCQHWSQAPDGADVLLGGHLAHRYFPHLARDISAIVHVRRAGHFSAQQLGEFMLDVIRARGVRLLRGRLNEVRPGSSGFTLDVSYESDRRTVEAGVLINAAGPFANEVAGMTGCDLPLSCVLQQKLAFEDRRHAVPRDSPFTIDIDEQTLAWQPDERESLAADPETEWLTRPMPGGIHCRPDGGEQGTWIKLGWAYNQSSEKPVWNPSPSAIFREIVVRGAIRANPSLEKYVGWLPRQSSQYCGYYTKTNENWPIIGPQGAEGTFVVAGLSGYGTMAACGAGELAAAWVCGTDLPRYAKSLSLERYRNPSLMAEITHQKISGEL